MVAWIGRDSNRNAERRGFRQLLDSIVLPGQPFRIAPCDNEARDIPIHDQVASFIQIVLISGADGRKSA